MIPESQPWSHIGTGAAGALCVHGFTGSPESMRGIAQTLADAGLHVELPLLPGHGTTIDDMKATGWAEWTAAVDAAYQRLAARAETIVVCGLSMGGALTLWTGLHRPTVAGLVCINPAAFSQPDEILDMVQGMIDEGTDVIPGIGSDIAEPGVVEHSYSGTPLRPLMSLMAGLAAQQDRYSELRMPLLLLTSEQDHVVDPDQSRQLAAAYGGPATHQWLTRSYHVATMDHDRDVINARVLEFVREVCG